MRDAGDHDARVGRDHREDRREEGVEEFHAPLGEPLEQTVGHRLAPPLQARQLSRQAEEQRGTAPRPPFLAREECQKGGQAGEVLSNHFAEDYRPGVDRRIDRLPVGHQPLDRGDADIFGADDAVCDRLLEGRGVKELAEIHRITGNARAAKPRRDDSRMRGLTCDRHRPADGD